MSRQSVCDYTTVCSVVLTLLAYLPKFAENIHDIYLYLDITN